MRTDHPRGPGRTLNPAPGLAGRREDDMKTYRVWYDNGAAVLVNANTADDARAMALEQADRDGYPGLKVERVEDITA